MKKNMSPPSHHPMGALFWPPLLKGTLIRRYKRFLADIELDSGKLITAHCPNTGSMAACAEPGRPVYVSQSDNPKRKLKYTWEMIEMPTSLVGVNTNVPNRLVYHAIKSDMIPELQGYDLVKREVPIGNRTRIDLALAKGDATCYVEIKNCTLVTDGIARFPDAVTERGRKHLIELQRMKETGARSVIFFFIQRMDATAFRPADDIDPQYGNALRSVLDQGVEALAYDVYIDIKSIRIHRPVPIVI